VVAGASFLLIPQGASAGGWWSHIDVDGERVAVGQRVHATTEFLFDSIPTAERARRSGGYYVYLLRDFDYGIVESVMEEPEPPDWWRLGGARPVRVGEVELDRFSGNLARARATLAIPELEPGRYALMFCDLSCAEPLGDIVPTMITIVDDPLTARLSNRLGRLRARAARDVRDVRASLNDVRADAARERDLWALQDELSALERRVLRVEKKPFHPWLPYAGWFLAGAACGVFLAARRRRPPARPPTGSPEDELLALERKLLTSGR
jgi:hypothetical protein